MNCGQLECLISRVGCWLVCATLYHDAGAAAKAPVFTTASAEQTSTDDGTVSNSRRATAEAEQVSRALTAASAGQLGGDVEQVALVLQRAGVWAAGHRRPVAVSWVRQQVVDRLPSLPDRSNPNQLNPLETLPGLYTHAAALCSMRSRDSPQCSSLTRASHWPKAWVMPVRRNDSAQRPRGFLEARPHAKSPTMLQTTVSSVVTRAGPGSAANH